MGYKIITISREFGSGGRYIGKTLADKLGITFMDKEIIAKVAKETGLADEFIEEKGEYAPIRNLFAYGLVGRNGNGQSLDDMLFAAQRKIILEEVEQGPCVIVGRSADYILREREDCLNVFIHGNEPEKVARICQLYNKSEQEAKKLLHDVDKKRAVNYKYYTEQKWGMANNYTISMNSSNLGYERCMDLIMQLYTQA